MYIGKNPGKPSVSEKKKKTIRECLCYLTLQDIEDHKDGKLGIRKFTQDFLENFEGTIENDSLETAVIAK